MLKLELNSEQYQAFLEFSGECVAAEVAADCQPTGAKLIFEYCVEIASWCATAQFGSKYLDLGDIQSVES